jgi:hypothetical protein
MRGPACWFVDEDYVHTKHAGFVKNLIEGGSRAAVGRHGQLQGLGYHWELWSLGSGGLSTHDALRTATIYGAETIGMASDIGTIEAGKFADIQIPERKHRRLTTSYGRIGLTRGAAGANLGDCASDDSRCSLISIAFAELSTLLCPPKNLLEASMKKSQSHGKIGEAAVAAKCWMNGVPAYNTAGLRANFAGSDLIVDTEDPKRKLLVQVKTGFVPIRDRVYFTQCAGECDLTDDKFVADFVVLVNIDGKVGESHRHEGNLDFKHLTYYVLPRDIANDSYKRAVQREYDRPKKTGEKRKLGNMAVYAPSSDVDEYRDAWQLLRDKCAAL